MSKPSRPNHPPKLRYRMEGRPGEHFIWVRARNDGAAIREAKLEFERIGIMVKHVQIAERPDRYDQLDVAHASNKVARLLRRQA